MRKYIVKRLISMIPAIFVVSVVIFMIIHLTPGDPAAVMLGDQADPEAIEALRESLGLNDPLPLQYLRWVSDVLHGDLGQSLYSDQTMIQIPGMGKMILTAVQQRDYEVVQAVVLFVSMINIVICLAVDLVYAAIDPRVRLGE